MTHSNLSYRCYILPIIAAIIYVILSLPIVNIILKDWIPDTNYLILIKSLILLVTLFLSCRLLDMYWYDFCHDEQCTAELNNVCMALTESRDNTTDTDNSVDNTEP